MRTDRALGATAWSFGLATIALVTWGVARAAPPPSLPWAPLTLAMGAVAAQGIPGRTRIGLALRVVAAGLLLLSASVWVRA